VSEKSPAFLTRQLGVNCVGRIESGIRLGVLPYYQALTLKKLLEEAAATVEVPNALEKLAKV
jgi:hypothetical protein